MSDNTEYSPARHGCWTALIVVIVIGTFGAFTAGYGWIIGALVTVVFVICSRFASGMFGE